MPSVATQTDTGLAWLATQVKQQVINLSNKVSKAVLLKPRLKVVRLQLLELAKRRLWQEVVAAGEAEAARQQRLGDDSLPSWTLASI